MASNAFSQGFNTDVMLDTEAGLEKDSSSLEERPSDGTVSSDQPGTASLFWKEYNEGWTLQPYFAYKTFTFGLKNNDSGREVKYVPSTNMNLGFRTVQRVRDQSFDSYSQRRGSGQRRLGICRLPVFIPLETAWF